MPYHLKGKCVYKGTKDSPGEKVKCHDTREDAVNHLKALYANVEDVMKELLALPCALSHMDAVLTIYKDHGQDRWLATSTAEVWDRQEEMFTTKAMDWDIARAYKLNEFPELRAFHVRGFKLGKCDSMARIGMWAVDKGYWNDTPFAQAFKDVVARNSGRWKVSRGFFTVEAAGHCRECDNGLTVHLFNYLFGAVCPQCKTYVPKPNMLSKLRVLKSVTFDITVTDVPAVGETAIAAYTIQ